MQRRQLGADSSPSEERIASLLRPYLYSNLPQVARIPTHAARASGHSETLESDRRELVAQSPIPGQLYAQIGLYLSLLQRWGTKTNLTAIRSPEEIIRRHFGESLYVARLLLQAFPRSAHGVADVPRTILDFGSGAGFPGLPIQLLLPHVQVTLAEGHGKKASFLREVVRELHLPTEVWARRVEEMPSERSFAAVTLRAVDDMERAIPEASQRVATGGVLVIMSTESTPHAQSGGIWYPAPDGSGCGTRIVLDPNVPRGTL
jgi:16S rRNA (guanine527-N7)-methyltransferase